MKFLKPLLISFLLLFVFTNTTQCSSSKKATESKALVLEKEVEIETGQVYFQKWIAGQEAGGSGINIFFPDLINKNNYALKDVYFRGMIGAMQSGKASYFASLKEQTKDLIMTNEEHGEYGNTAPNKPEDFPFTLEDSECVISYLDNNTIKYIQINNIIEKQGEYYPSAPPKQN